MPSKEQLAIWRKKAKEFMGFKGKTKGLSFLPDIRYIEFREGKDGLKRLEELMREVGYPFVFSDIDSYEWYHEGYAVLMYYLLMEGFGWSEEDIYKMGKASPNISFIMKFVLSFVSIEKTFQEGPSLFSKHYDFGRMEATELNMKDQYLILTVYGYPFPEITSHYLRGFIAQALEIIIKPKELTVTCSPCGEENEMCQVYRVEWTV